MPKPAWILPLLAYVAFVSLGLPDTVLGVAWPELRRGFALPQSAIGAVLLAGTCGYFCSGLVAGGLTNKFGVGGLLTASSGLVALAMVGYSIAPVWSMFFPLAILVGLGSGAIDAGLNGYAAQHLSARSLNWLHACWGLGASLGPYIMTRAIVSGHGYRGGYAWIAAVLGGMALVFLLTRRGWDEPAPTKNSELNRTPTGASGARATLGRRGVWLHVAIFFVYTGVEASVGQWCFTWMREHQGLTVDAAGYWTAAYWASLTIGRVVLGALVNRVGPDRLLRCSSLAVVLGTLLFASTSGILSRLGLLALGLGLAPFFPTLVARTPARVGADIARYSVGFQISAATLGGALVPAGIGVLVSRTGVGAIGAAIVGLSIALLLVHELLILVTRVVHCAQSP